MLGRQIKEHDMGDTLENVGRALEWFGEKVTDVIFPETKCLVRGGTPEACHNQSDPSTIEKFVRAADQGMAVLPYLKVVNPLFFAGLQEAANAVRSGVLTKQQAEDLKDFGDVALPLIRGAAKGLLGGAATYAAKEVLNYLHDKIPQGMPFDPPLGTESIIDYFIPSFSSDCGPDLPFWALGPVAMISDMACREISRSDISGEELGRGLVDASALLLGSALVPGGGLLLHHALKQIDADSVKDDAKSMAKALMVAAPLPISVTSSLVDYLIP